MINLIFVLVLLYFSIAKIQIFDVSLRKHRENDFYAQALFRRNLQLKSPCLPKYFTNRERQ